MIKSIKKTWCPTCGAKTFTNKCEDANCKSNEIPQCKYCNKIGVDHYGCNCEEKKIAYRDNALEFSKDLLDWLRNEYVVLPEDSLVGAQFENGFTEWLGIGFGFKLDDISNVTGITIDELRSIIQKFCPDECQVSLRMANSDVWVLQNPELSKIMHQYLRVVLKSFL